MADEVSIRALDLPLTYLRQRRFDIESLFEDLPISDRILSKRSARIDWRYFVEINRRIHSILGDADAVVAIGHSLGETRVWRPLKIALRAIASLPKLYGWIAGAGQKSMFSNLTMSVQPTPDGLRFQIAHGPEYEVCEEYFLITKGVLESTPQLLGYRLAAVAMHRSGCSTTYEVVLPPTRSFVDVVRSQLARVRLNPVAAATEIEHAYQLLDDEHRQLKAANVVVERQAKLLGSIEAIARTLLRETEPTRIATTVQEVLLDRVGFAAVAFYTIAPDGSALRLGSCSLAAGPLTDAELADPDPSAIAAHLAERWPPARVEALRAPDGQFLGMLVALPREDGTTDLELFRALLPHLSIAARHSLAYTTLEEMNRGLERRVDERTLQLTRARDDLLAAYQKLESAMASRDRLFANLNHEFRTPITLLLLPLERLANRPDLKPYQAQLTAAALNGRKLLRLVDGLLELAASREGRLRLKLERIDLTAIAREALAAYTTAASDLDLGLTLEAAGPVMIYGNGGALSRIFDNLIGNAIKYTPREGQIIVSVGQFGDTARVAVRDTGIGIADADQGRIFERFERAAPPLVPGAGGSGIGLALVKELCEWHGGAVSVDSHLGKGSTFEITLPCLPTREMLARQDRREASMPDGPERRRDDFTLDVGAGLAVTGTLVPPPSLGAMPTPLPVPPGAPTVLVVEDHPEMRSHLVQILGAHFHVLSAQDGKEALALAAKQPVDLILSDLVMPGSDGLDLCKRVKSTPAFDMVPFLLLTAMHDKETLVHALELGADDFVVKPFNEAELLARVRSQLRIRALARGLTESSRMAAVGTLLSGMAHELRNPVNVLVNGVGPLRESLLPETTAANPAILPLVDAVDDAARRVSELTEELLAFRRAPEETEERVKLSDLIEQSLSLLRPKLAGVKVQTDVAYDGEVVGSAHRLSQVVMNLVENAVQAIGGGSGQVGIATRDGPDGVELDVWDDGPGIPSEQRDRIFEPFFTTKPPGVGNGLGLAISRQIAERHGGRLALAPSERGARFRLTLPRATH